MKQKRNAFSMIEIMLGIIIVSIIMISWFYALSSVSIWKIKLIESTNIEKELFYFSEKFFDAIKSWGLIDYEEYFNRKNVGATTYLSGHYDLDTWFGNEATEIYYCRSWSGNLMGTWGCIASHNTSWGDLTGTGLLYGQYAYQFIDFNSNADSDWWDEDWDGLILWDDDDEYLGLWPSAFSSSWAVDEIYLLSPDWKKRTFFRWHVKTDPYAPIAATCSGFTNEPSLISGSGCLWTIEVLYLEWVDWWNDHIKNTSDNTEYDGVVDTWIYEREIYGVGEIVASAWTDEDYWVSLFPEDVNVKNIEFFLYPHKDINYTWKEEDSSINIAPYLRINMILSPWWRKRVAIKWDPWDFNFSTTLSLNDILLR